MMMVWSNTLLQNWTISNQDKNLSVYAKAFLISSPHSFILASVGKVNFSWSCFLARRKEASGLELCEWDLFLFGVDLSYRFVHQGYHVTIWSVLEINASVCVQSEGSKALGQGLALEIRQGSLDKSEVTSLRIQLRVSKCFWSRVLEKAKNKKKVAANLRSM